MRKGLDFWNLPNLSFTANASVMHSMVRFGDDAIEHDRPMQGQSPYLINTGLFYQSERLGFSAGLLYNRIGERIVGIGRTPDSQGNVQNNTIPDIYEMPRNALDLTLSQRISDTFEVKLAVRDILAEPVKFMQFPEFEDASGVMQEREQITKMYNPGRSFSVSVSARF